MKDLHHKLDKGLKAREQIDALRSLSDPIDGLIDLSSNDYLGIANNISDLEITGGSGATGSRLLTGNSRKAIEVEQELASWLGAEAALVFPSGYTANLGLISVLAGRNDTVVYDQSCHASIRDAITLSRAKSLSFKHNDIEDCDKKLRAANGNVLLVVEGLYSMDGDWVLLEALMELADVHNASVVVDEAHSIGLKGQSGEGLCFSLDLHDRVLARTVGFGKAFGYHGGCVLGSDQLRKYLINYSRPFIYTTGLPDHYYDILSRVMHQVQLAEEGRSRLDQLIHDFNVLFADSKIEARQSPIQAIPIGGNSRTREVAAGLTAAGMGCKAILAPTVPEGEEMIRVILHSFNSSEHLVQLKTILKEIWQEGFS